MPEQLGSDDNVVAGVLLALLSLNELLHKRTEIDCSFHQGVDLGYRIQATISFD